MKISVMIMQIKARAIYTNGKIKEQSNVSWVKYSVSVESLKSGTSNLYYCVPNCVEKYLPEIVNRIYKESMFCGKCRN